MPDCQRLMRFLLGRFPPAQAEAAMIGLMGDDPQHDAQWYAARIEHLIQLEGWDDMRQWKHQHGIAA